MKKSLSLLVAIAMVFSMFATLVSAAETQTAGQKLQDLGIIKGTSNGLDEDKEWLRKDVTVLLARLYQVEDAARNHANTHGFTDVDSKGYNGFISWAKENDYFKGLSTTKFGPNDAITNQQFAQVLLRVLKVDVEYSEAFEKAVELKLISADLNKTDAAVRGDIYESLVTALDYKIDGKKLGTILGLKGYEVADVEVVKASATNSKTVVVEFNQEVKDVVASNFVVTNADGAVQVIESVSTSAETVTIKLADSLSNGKEYTVTATGVVSKDGEQTQKEESAANFTYTATAPVSVEIATKTVGYGDTVKYVVKDAKGNDITPDIAAGNISVASSDQNVIGSDLKAKNLGTAVGYSVVNVTVIIDDEGNTIETGNIAIKVQPTVNEVNGITELTLGDLGKDAVTSIFEKTSGVFDFKVVDKNNGDIAKADLAKVTFKSSNPTVLVVDSSTGVVNAIKTGSSTVTLTVEYNGKTVSKSVVITVKNEAKLSGLDVSATATKLVIGAKDSAGADLTETVKATVKDQYNDAFKAAAGEKVSVTATKSGVVTLNGVALGSTAQEVTINADGVAELTFAIDASVTDAATTVVKVTKGTFSKTIAVSVVKPAALSGYTVEVSATKLDLSGKSNAQDPNALDDKSAVVKVYAKDVNGNKIGEITTGVVVSQANENGGAVNVSGTTITPNEVGTEVVTVSVNGVKVGTYTITVVNTNATLTKVVQVKNAVTFDGVNLAAQLFGTDKNGGAFVGYDQYGEKIAFASGDYVIYSSNQAIIKNDLTAGGSTGSVLLTVVSKDSVYTITVKVN